MTSPEYFTRFEPQSPQYKKLKNDTITSLTLAITDQNNDIVPDHVVTLAQDGTIPNMGWPNKELTTLSLLRPKIP